MILKDFKQDMSDAERETRQAVVAYKQARISGDKKEIERARLAAVALVNKSPDHIRWLRRIVEDQPPHVREEDRFLDLLNEAPEKGVE